VGGGMSEPSAWPSQAYLDALRPDAGTAVTGAILTSYSADLPSIVAALLALGGRDNDAGSGNKTDLAEAVEELRGKVRILIQRGRLARLKRMPPIAAILDQFIREIDFDEREHSWHPKVALLRLANGEASPAWRIWLGSRNLTAAINRDFGILLTSAADPKSTNAATVAGLSELAGRLAAHAGLEGFGPARTRTAVAGIRWTQPAPFTVERVTLTSGKGSDKALPVQPDADEVIAVSPFLDGGIVRSVGAWGGPRTTRLLLSTPMELAKLASQAQKPLAAFENKLFVLEAPAPDAIEAEPRALKDEESSEDGEDEQLIFGLHAKILAVRKARKMRFWVGSANATQRAWNGDNVEVIAELSASVVARKGLDELFTQARPLSLAQLEAMKVAPKGGTEDRLEDARKAVVAGWRGKLTRDGNVFSVHAHAPPHPVDEAISLEVGLATGTLVAWPRGQALLALGEYSAGLHTQLLQFRLTLGDIECSWLQCVDVTPPFGEDRDRHTIAHHLGMSAFLAWIAALLAGEPTGDGGDPWDEPRLPGNSAYNNLLAVNLLTLDAMLACWARDRALFGRVAQRINSYLGPVMAGAASMPGEDLHRLTAFQSVWNIVSNELLKEH
jgi:hypothetical protein